MTVAIAPSTASANVPRYEQVKAHVLQHLHSGAWPPGHRLPSENELVAQFGLARMTVNRALRELQDAGHIVRVAGVGSFVAERKPQSTLLRIANIETEIRGRGHTYKRDLLLHDRIAADATIAEALHCKVGDDVFHTLTLHHENGVPVQLEERWVNPRIVPAFGDQDFVAESPSAYLVRTVPFDSFEHIVDAVLPTTAQAQLLAMPASDPCLQLTRRTFLGERPVTFVHCLHPAARYQLGSRFSANGAVMG